MARIAGTDGAASAAEAASFEHVHNFLDFGADGAYRRHGQGSLGARRAQIEGAEFNPRPPRTCSVTGVLPILCLSSFPLTHSVQTRLFLNILTDLILIMV